MPTYTYFHWEVWGKTIYEGMVDDVYIAIGQALCVVLPMLFIAIAVQRWEDYRNDPRHK